jgi:hypothetical protein
VTRSDRRQPDNHIAIALAGAARAVEDSRIASLNLPAFLSPSFSATEREETRSLWKRRSSVSLEIN